MKFLYVDQGRYKQYGETGIYVRAFVENGECISCDIADLEKESLLVWLKKNNGENRVAEDVVGILLGHGHLHPTE